MIALIVKACISEEYCKEQDKLDFPEIGGKNMT